MKSLARKRGTKDFFYEALIIACAFLLTGFRSNLLTTTEMPPAPQLVYPSSQEVILKGMAYLEFKWIIFHSTEIKYCEFRLYKDYNSPNRKLFFQQRVPPAQASLKLKSSLFQDNQVYTWVINEVSFSGVKSDQSTISFKVRKK